MAVLDNIVLNGTSYSIGTSDSVVTHDPTYYGLNLENNVLGDHTTIPLFKFPCSSFTDSVLTYVAKGSTEALNTRVRIETDGGRYTAPVLLNTTILVGRVYYRVYCFQIALSTSVNPNNWSIYIPLPSTANADVKIFGDVPVDNIDAELIAKIFEIPQGFASLNGKKWLALGDSYTNYLNDMWSSIATKNGMGYSNYGVASSTIRVSSGGSDFAVAPMSQRVDTLISEHAEEADDIGLVTFMGGTNDGYTPAKIGTLESTELTTIYGGCHHIFNSLINAFPKALVLVILQPVSGNASATESGFDAYQNSIYGCQIKQRAVKEVAEFYGLPICDCCFDWYTTANPNDLATFWRSDKLHLTDKGNAKLTEKVTDKINSILTIKR